MTSYPRLARETPGFEHWRLPVAAVVGGGAFGVVNVGVGIAVVAYLALTGTDIGTWLDSPAASAIALDEPVVLFLQLASLAVLVPIVLLSVRLVWPRHTGFIHSVEGRLRWRWLRRCLLLAFTVVGASLVLSVVVALVTGDDSAGFEVPSGAGLVSLLVVLAVVPFQAAGEEYLFRGGLLQLIGSWTRWAWVPVVVTSVLFAAGHVYDFWGLLSVGLFGVVAAILTIRTGGLEAPIALHVANNVVLMTFDLFGLVDSSGEGAGFLNEVVPSTLTCLVFWAAVEWAARRTGLQRTRPPLPEPPVPRFGPPPPYVPSGVPVGGPHVAAPLPRPVVPPNAPPYPGDPGVWGR